MEPGGELDNKEQPTVPNRHKKPDVEHCPVSVINTNYHIVLLNTTGHHPSVVQWELSLRPMSILSPASQLKAPLSFKTKTTEFIHCRSAHKEADIVFCDSFTFGHTLPLPAEELHESWTIVADVR